MTGADARDSREIERDLERTRAEIGQTIDELEYKLTPGRLVDEAWTYMRESGWRSRGGGESPLARAVRENPLPLVLIGVGLAWLGYTVATQRGEGRRYYDDEPDYGPYRPERTTQTRRSTMASRGPGPEVMGAKTLIGDKVSNPQGENLGKIEEIMLDMYSGRVAYAVLSFGGIMGMGDKLFALPWHALRLDAENKQFLLDVPKERLQQAPGFDKNAWPRMANEEWATQVHEFYGTDPYWY